MRIEKIDLVGSYDPEAKITGAVKQYRKQPGNREYALYAAVYYAQKHGIDYAVIAGDSYMQRVYNIVDVSKLDVTKFAPAQPDREFLIVYTDGAIVKAKDADAEKSPLTELMEMRAQYEAKEAA